MKYFTKEWYETCQNSDWHLNMSVSKNAEEFSEEYYKDLYTRRRRAFVKEQKEMAEAKGEAFDKAAAEVAFLQQHEAAVKRMEASIPQTILAEVADTRVLALDIATKEVKQKLKTWCEQNKKEADAKVKEYDGLKMEENLHDAVIRTMEMKAETLTFKLEGSDGLTLAVELVCLGVFDGDGVDVDVNAQTLLDIGYGLLNDGECLQTEEVHLDQACVLNHATFILCDQQLLARFLVVGCAHGHPISNRVAADNGTTSVYTCSAYVSLEHLGILDGVAQYGIGRCLGLL